MEYTKQWENVTFCRSFHAYAMSDAVHLLSREQIQMQRDQPKKKKMHNRSRLG